jgi:hypothetical protein
LGERSRGHIHPVMLNATFYVAISKLMAKLECSKSAAILYALNEGLFSEGVISEGDYDLLKRRYGRKLKEVIAAGREDSHKPVLTLEKIKAKNDLDQKDKQFQGMLEQWDLHPDPKWREKAFQLAGRYLDRLESARKLLALKDAGET